ncbi:MAG TPA: (d)CMP kinase [Candidatus Saccharimonadales bacterium]|nr:(d)CMP kinase [Candidatus Saccharimonadales bacterium]
MIITIDGPSGSGKSTLAIALAHHLNFFCLNSGYLYRGLAYVLKTFYAYDEQKMRNPDIKDIQACLLSGNFEYKYESGLAKIYWIDDITIFLKDPELAHLVAILAQNPLVRAEIRKFERILAQEKDMIAEGRSCGSVVFPEAEIKFYVDASPDIRARRLQADQKKCGIELPFDQAIHFVQQRDKMDKERVIEPLIKPQGAIVLDSSTTSKQDLLQKALEIIKKELKKEQ